METGVKIVQVDDLLSDEGKTLEVERYSLP